MSHRVLGIFVLWFLPSKSKIGVGNDDREDKNANIDYYKYK
jgi:hypothetical protein